MAVAFLAKLRDFQDNVTCFKGGTYLQSGKIHTIHQQVFTKIPVRDTAALFIKFPDAFSRQEAHLTVPFSGMGVVADPVVFQKIPAGHGMLIGAFLFADTDCFYNSHQLSSYF